AELEGSEHGIVIGDHAALLGGAPNLVHAVRRLPVPRASGTTATAHPSTQGASMDFFPELFIDEAQAEVIARGLFAVARAEGGVHEREAAMVKSFFGEAVSS